jgi:hypothetical protein
MTTQAIRLTDPAAELAALWDSLSKIDDDAQAAYVVLGTACKAHPDSIILLEMLSVIGKRINNLLDFAHRTSDPFFTERVKGNLINHLRKMSGMLAPNQLVQQWGNYKAAFINEDQITALESVSSIIRTHQPLRMLSDDERAELIEAVQDIASGEGFTDFPEWAAVPLRHGFERLLFCLRYLEFFGHEFVIDQLLALQQHTQIIGPQIAAAAGNENAASAARSVFRMAEVIAVAVHLFIAPHHVSEAYHHYRGYLAPTHAAPMKLLEGPSVKAITSPKAPRITHQKKP